MPLAPAAPRSCLPPADALRMGLQRCSAGDTLPPIFTGPRVSLLSFLKDIFRRGQGSSLAVSRFQRVEGAFRGLLAVAVPGQDAADGDHCSFQGNSSFVCDCSRLFEFQQFPSTSRRVLHAVYPVWCVPGMSGGSQQERWSELRSGIPAAGTRFEYSAGPI